MFGLLRPSSQGMRCSERREFNRFYCGLCKGLDHHHGTLTRGLLSYDGVFVALLTDALVDETRAAQPDKCRCPLLPLVHRPTVKADSLAMTFAASVQMLLFDQWAADGGRSLVRRFSRPHAERAHTRLDALGVSLRALEDFDRVQADVEAREEVSPTDAAAPTENALRLVFANIATLHGGHTETLSELGAAIGRTIYWVDALEDLDDDLRKHAFNPCIAHGARSPRRVTETASLLRADVDRMPILLESLPLVRHRTVLHDILGNELRQRALRAIDGVRRAPPRPLARLHGFAIAFALVVWAWLCAVPRAFAAAPEKPSDAGRHSIDDAGRDADASNDWQPVPNAGSEPAPVPSSEPEPTGWGTGDKDADASKKSSDGGGIGSPCTICSDCGNTCRDCCGAPERCCSGCTNCCTNCSECGKGCDGCGKACGKCGNCGR